MVKFPRKADLLEQVQVSGGQYLDNVRSNNTSDNADSPKSHDFNQMIFRETARKKGGFIIDKLVTTPKSLMADRLMNQPFFSWNESLDDPIIYRHKNMLVNSEDCFPSSLLVLAMDYVNLGYGVGDTIYDQFVKKVGAAFCNSATPRDFQMDADSRSVPLRFIDPEKSPPIEDGHTASGQLMYNIIANGGLPGFDIHDITHHASQMALYGEFYSWLASQATEEIMQSPTRKLAKHAIKSVMLTTLEYSIIGDGNRVQSFGCLNWQAPHKSVLKNGVSLREEYYVYDYPYGAQDIHNWSAVRAIAAIYREQLSAQRLTAQHIDWMKDLGYSIDREFLDRIKPGESYDYSDLEFDAASKATIIAPESPEELFGNAKQLIERVVNE